MRDIINFVVIPAFAAILFFALVFGCIAGFVALTQYNVCESYTAMDAQHNYHYDFWTGCVVQLENERWIGVDNYQQLQIDCVK